MMQFFKKINWMKVFSILMIGNFLINLHSAYNEVYEVIHMSETSYVGYGLSEFLINWKGGYVRRGLIGELLYRLCEVTGWQPAPIIIAICIISCVAFAAVFFIMLKNADISWWIMFIPFTLGAMPVVRKDHLCFLLVVLILYFLKKTFIFLWIKLLFIYLASCLLIHIHEAFFFVIVPFTIIYLYFYEFSAWDNKIAKFIFSAIPLVVPFLLICHYHGDENTAHIIHDSWTQLCPSLANYQFTTDDSIGAIGWKSFWAIKNHLRQCFIIRNPLVPILIYYLISRFLLVFNIKKQEVKNSQSVLNAILQFQFLTLLPLFTVLSCDVDRICMYWTVSSLCIYCMLRTEVLQILSYNDLIFNTTKNINSLYDYVFKPSKVLLCILILFISVPQIGRGWGASSVSNGFVSNAKFLLRKAIK